MRLRCVTPPASEVVTLQQAKAWLRVDGDEEDALISGLIAAAVAHLDGWSGVLGRALEEQTWERKLDGFPSGDLLLPLGPVVEVVSVAYVNGEGAAQVMPAESYTVELHSTCAWVRPVDGWPEGRSVAVTWVAGEGCPEPIRQAIRMLVAHWHRNREAVGPVGAAGVAEIPMGVAVLIEPLRVVPS